MWINVNIVLLPVKYKMLLWQFAQQERQQILEFESHLAAATSKVTITEANSLLISQLTTMDPK